ncbi:hypothetical protein B0H13DRAFT_2666967 [Mycena leptocephala]|nr:hypothetical protein B0H13DRAFT_2666967 [Mycena leptocephala]
MGYQRGVELCCHQGKAPNGRSCVRMSIRCSSASPPLPLPPCLACDASPAEFLLPDSSLPTNTSPSLPLPSSSFTPSLSFLILSRDPGLGLRRCSAARQTRSVCRMASAQARTIRTPTHVHLRIVRRGMGGWMDWVVGWMEEGWHGARDRCTGRIYSEAATELLTGGDESMSARRCNGAVPTAPMHRPTKPIRTRAIDEEGRDLSEAA